MFILQISSLASLYAITVTEAALLELAFLLKTGGIFSIMFLAFYRLLS